VRLLVFNAGSSSLKYRLFEVSNDESPVENAAVRGVVERIGESAGDVADHAAAVRQALAKIRRSGAEAFNGFAHRVVHGGEDFAEAVRIDDETLAAIERATALAPLHNGPALAVIRECRREASAAIPQLAVFDTAFHRTLPERAFLYALPLDLARRHGVRRFGFHGLSYRSMIGGWSRAAGRPIDGSRLIAFHLGNGASACAIRDGRSVDTSMGFTPLEGLVMGTRSGDIDPALVPYLAQREGVSCGDIVELLNERSGLAGVSGVSRDVREIENAAASGNSRAGLALEIFVYRARKYLGAYLAALSGADAVLFGGGIGEHAAGIRASILEGLEELGISLDRSRNASASGGATRVSSDGSRIGAWVVPTDEEAVIARDAAALLDRAES
jgi:acetate kinase